MFDVFIDTLGDVIQGLRTELSLTIEAQSVAHYMHEECALTDEELQSIQSRSSEPILAAEQLMSIIINRPRHHSILWHSVYSRFLVALIDTDQLRIREIIILETANGEGCYAIR